MRWIRFSLHGKTAYAIAEGDRIVEVAGDPFSGYERTPRRHDLGAVKIEVPVQAALCDRARRSTPAASHHHRKVEKPVDAGDGPWRSGEIILKGRRGVDAGVEKKEASRLGKRKGEVLGLYLQQHASSLKPATRSSYSRIVEQRLKPGLGGTGSVWTFWSRPSAAQADRLKASYDAAGWEIVSKCAKRGR